MKSNDWRVLKPCPKDWEQMLGDDRRRFCDHCRKVVHNVSAMIPADRADFAKASGEHQCIVYFQRPDGEVANLSLLAAIRRWIPFLRLARWSMLVALLPAILTGCMGRRRPQPITGMMAMPKAEPITAIQAGRATSPGNSHEPSRSEQTDSANQ